MIRKTPTIEKIDVDLDDSISSREEVKNDAMQRRSISQEENELSITMEQKSEETESNMLEALNEVRPPSPKSKFEVKASKAKKQEVKGSKYRKNMANMAAVASSQEDLVMISLNKTSLSNNLGEDATETTKLVEEAKK